PLEAAERRAEALEPRDDVLERDPERLRERGRGQRVVDVVETGDPQPNAPRALGGDERERRMVEPGELDVARHEVERRARVAAGGTAIVPEVADVGRRVVVRRPADDAVLRVGGVLERGPRDPWIVEPED